jgi:hypothetical protein
MGVDLLGVVDSTTTSYDDTREEEEGSKFEERVNTVIVPQKKPKSRNALTSRRFLCMGCSTVHDMA